VARRSGPRVQEMERRGSMVRTLSTRRTNPESVLKSVAIVAGTHGNELAGQLLLRHFRTKPAVASRPSFETTCVISNVDASKVNRRYVDTDLNRCFDYESLEKSQLMAASARNVEESRSLEIDAQLGPKFDENPAMDLILDLHNTTANCGVLLCFHKEDLFAKQIAAYLKHFDPEICSNYWSEDDPPYLPTVGRSGMTLEVGPLPHSTVRAEIYDRTLRLIQRVLDYVEMHNTHLLAKMSGKESPFHEVSVSFPVAARVARLDFPRDSDDNITAMIHPSLQGIKELQPSGGVFHESPVFQNLDGTALHLDYNKLNFSEQVDMDEELYPLFVNEAAYYEKGVALFLAKLGEENVVIVKPKQSSL